MTDGNRQTNEKMINGIKQKPGVTVFEMWIGTVLFAILCEFIGIWFVKDRAAYTMGIVSGALLSCFATWHIWYMLDSSLETGDEKTASRRIGTGYLIRYFALIILIVVLYLTRIGSPFAAFIAYFGMKPAAYMQPFIHRLLRR